MSVALTKSAVDSAVARAQAGERIELVDGQEQSLRLRAGERGAKWSVLLRLASGERIRVPVGPWPSVGIAEARQRARSMKAEASAGKDPRSAREEAKAASTVKELLELYEEQKLSQLRTMKATRQSLNRALASVMRRAAPSVTRRDIAKLIDESAKKAPIHANRQLAYIKAFFGWAVERGHLETNPASDISMPQQEAARDRFPTLPEIGEIWSGAEQLGWPFGSALRLLILIPSRREEIAAMGVSELDLEGGVWSLPGSRTKTGRALRVPLAPLAIKIIKEALQARTTDKDLIFSTTGGTPVSGWSKAKARLDMLIAEKRSEAEQPPMEHWRIHDLRRSFATVAADVLRIDPLVADRCLNHVGAATSGTVQRTYGRSELFDQRRDALTAWAHIIEKQLGEVS